MIQYSFVWYLSPVVFTGSPTCGKPERLARGSILGCMDEDKKSEGRFGVGRKHAIPEVEVQEEYQMNKEDFIKTMRQALSVPPMPRKARKKVRVVGE